LAVRSHLGVELELDAPPDPIEIPQNALVEIESLDTLCLGKVGLCEAGRVLVILEHTVDLHKLGRIQEVWHAPQA
jgi:hypothetical protein